MRFLWGDGGKVGLKHADAICLFGCFGTILLRDYIILKTASAVMIYGVLKKS